MRGHALYLLFVSMVLVGVPVGMLGGCVGAVGLPPTRTELSSAMATGRGGAIEHGQRVSSGVHWASGTRSRRVPFDVGAGVVYERMGAETPEIAKADAASGGPASGSKSQASEPAYRYNLGGYVEASRRLSASGATRSWIGGRAEVVRDTQDRGMSMSLAGRIAWEVYSGGAGAGAEGDGNAFVMYAAGGTIGIGSYVESGVRLSPENNAEFLLSAGLSLRLPAFVLVGIGCR